jgi:fatty acid desaturase
MKACTTRPLGTGLLPRMGMPGGHGSHDPFSSWLDRSRAVLFCKSGREEEGATIAPSSDKRLLEIPTLAVALVIFGGYLAVTWFFRVLPLAIAASLGSVLLTWYGSLQHETIHGHPTSSPRFNSWLAALPLSLWLPYGIYREIHLRHHLYDRQYLTDPIRDTESYYLTPGVLREAGSVRRAIYHARCTLAGRLLLGPALAMWALWRDELRRVRSGERGRVALWLRHACGVALVLAWVVGVCRIPLAMYVGLVIYPGTALTQLRSFAEHRAHADPTLRTASVECSAPLALLYLNNNLHVAHHAEPALPWYELPRAWRRIRASAYGSRVCASGLIYRHGYLGIVGHYLFRPIITVEYPVPSLSAK